MSRTKKTVINTTVGLFCTGISYILSFVLQALFIRLLGLEYAGVNSLFTSILNILNLVDLGFNNAILFKLYKVIADDDKEKITLYLATYRKICLAVGTIVGLAGICCIPFLSVFVKEQPTFSEPLWSLYLIILGNSVLSHFVNYRGIILIAKQERYIGIIIQYICMFLKHGLQILLLFLYKNIYVYLLIPCFVTLLEGMCNGLISRKRYGVSWKSKKTMSKEETKEISKDIGTLAVFKLCRTLNGNIDTFLISKFVAVTQTAIYGSTTVLTAGLSNLIDTINDGMIAGIGDLNANGDEEGLENILFMSFHTMFLLYGICSAVLVPFMGTFMNWWVGYTLPDVCLFVLIFNFYTGGINANISTYRNAMGLYRKGWKRPAATVIVNCVTSYFLINRIGLLGAFVGTTIANVTTMLWYDPLIVFKYGIHRSSKKFFKRYIMYAIFTLITAILLFYFGRILPAATTFISLFWHGILYFFVAVIIMCALGSIFPEQKRIIDIILGIVFKKNAYEKKLR